MNTNPEKHLHRAYGMLKLKGESKEVEHTGLLAPKKNMNRQKESNSAQNKPILDAIRITEMIQKKRSEYA